jgi:4-amino-4-deoxy-L-arabinose transferase-like glycosyltransferase
MAEGTLLLGVTLAIWTILNARERPWLAGLGLAFAYNAKQSTIALVPVAIIAIVWLHGYTKFKTKIIIKNVTLFLSVFLFITLALNPLYWSNPRQALQASFSARQELVEQQIKDTIMIAPEKYLETPLQRLFILVINIFISPPEYGLVGNLAPTREDVDAYISFPGHNLFRGIILGSVFLVLCIFGIYVAIRTRGGQEPKVKRDLTLLLLATLFQASVLVATVPLSWARYSVPMIPFTSIWIAFGISSLVPKQIIKPNQTPE